MPVAGVFGRAGDGRRSVGRLCGGRAGCWLVIVAVGCLVGCAGDGRRSVGRLCNCRLDGWLVLMALRCALRCAGEIAVVDKAEDALSGQRIVVGAGVDGEIRQRVATDGVQDTALVFRDDLDVPVEHHPIAGSRQVAVAQRVPAVMRLRVLADGDDAG
jgi:hypothetical protein